MINETRAEAPHEILLAIVLVLLIGVPKLLGIIGSKALTSSIAEHLSPLGLLLIPIILLLLIQFLSSGEPESINRASGSPVSVALVLLLVLVLLYAKVCMFRGGGYQTLDVGPAADLVRYSDV